MSSTTATTTISSDPLPDDDWISWICLTLSFLVGLSLFVPQVYENFRDNSRLANLSLILQMMSVCAYCCNFLYSVGCILPWQLGLPQACSLLFLCGQEYQLVQWYRSAKQVKCSKRRGQTVRPCDGGNDEKEEKDPRRSETATDRSSTASSVRLLDRDFGDSDFSLRSTRSSSNNLNIGLGTTFDYLIGGIRNSKFDISGAFFGVYTRAAASDIDPRPPRGKSKTARRTGSVTGKRKNTPNLSTVPPTTAPTSDKSALTPQQERELRAKDYEEMRLHASLVVGIVLLTVALMAYYLYKYYFSEFAKQPEHCKAKTITEVAFAEVCGYCSMLLFGVMFLPQIYKNYKIKDASALSPGFIVLNVLRQVLQIVAAVRKKLPLVSGLGPAITFVVGGVLLFQWYIYEHRKDKPSHDD